MSEFAVLGWFLGLTHFVAESLVHALWGVGLTWLDWGIGGLLCGLLGLAGGAAVWLIGLAVRSGRQREPGCVSPVRLGTSRLWWESEIGRRRLCWVGMAILHTLMAWSIVWQRAAGFDLVATLTVSAVVGIVLLILGYRCADSLLCLLIASVGLTCANVGATTLPTVLPDLPTSGRVLTVALTLLCLPVACIIAVSPARRFRPAGALTRRTAVSAAGGLIIVTMLLSLTVFPLALDWHVRRGSATPWPKNPDSPNVLLVVLDTVRADHLDFFGYPRETMPALSRFAAESCQVTRAIMATAPCTLPTHASMFTGHHSHTHGGHLRFVGDEGRGPDYGYPMREDIPTLAEHLTGLGFQTAGISANYGILSGYGLSRGFNHYDVVQGPAFQGRQLTWLYAGPTHENSFGKFLSDKLPEALGRRTQLFNRWAPPYRRAELITDRTLAWLRERDDRPFFLFLNYLDAHRPYVPPPEHERRFAPEGSKVRWVGFLPGGVSEKFMRRETSGPQPWREHLVGLYDAELAYLDGELSRLLDELQRQPWWDNTLVIILSDHGEAFAEHGLLEHGTSVYDTQVRVPLFIKFPASMAETPPRVSPWFQFVDIYPSIMDMLGEEAPPDIAGMAWGGQREWALTQAFVNRYDIPWLDRELCAVMLEGHKYIVSTTGRVELYDLSVDPGETRDLVGTRPELEARARAIVEQRDAALVTDLEPADKNAALQQKLRSLGYLK